jgi:hypothetical protein
MITLDELLRDGPLLVKGKVTKAIFMVSAVRGTGGVIGIAAYEPNEPRPSDKKHLMLSANRREQYLLKLDKVCPSQTS